VLRLAGKNDKAVRQLALPYGGGKTHTLITLYHLVNDPKKLPDLPAVREFNEAFGGEPPRTRVVALCFDKIERFGGERDLSVRVAPPAVAGRRLNRSTTPGAEGPRLISVERVRSERRRCSSDGRKPPVPGERSGTVSD